MKIKTRYFVSNNVNARMAFVKKSKPFGKRIAIYNKIPVRDLASYFDKCIKLTDLYKDEVFLNLLPSIDSKTSIFLIDLGIDYCSFQANYIKPYTKLMPICQQTKHTFIIDGFAFYNTEKSIYRPFLYIDDRILDSTVQEFYNSGALYKDFDGNKVENYCNKIKPYIEIQNKPIEIQSIHYTPTDKEKKDYEALKEDIIMCKKLSKVRVISELQKFIRNSSSRKKALSQFKDSGFLIEENTANWRKKMYSEIILHNHKSITFIESGFYGIDNLELSRTKEAIIKHNKLINLINGN